ncbi:hypothetical protein AAFA46_00795 [Oscillospiraceae bacterium WX1]
MSLTRILFIAICVIVAAVLILFGSVVQKNGLNATFSKAFGTEADGEKRRWLKLPKNAASYMTIALLLSALILFLLFLKR